jgi:hypothetical protein
MRAVFWQPSRPSYPQSTNSMTNSSPQYGSQASNATRLKRRFGVTPPVGNANCSEHSPLLKTCECGGPPSRFTTHQSLNRVRKNGNGYREVV